MCDMNLRYIEYTLSTFLVKAFYQSSCDSYQAYLPVRVSHLKIIQKRKELFQYWHVFIYALEAL